MIFFFFSTRTKLTGFKKYKWNFRGWCGSEEMVKDLAGEENCKNRDDSKGTYRVVKLTWLLKYLLGLNISQKNKKTNKHIFWWKKTVFKTQYNVWCYSNTNFYCFLKFPFKIHITLEHFTLFNKKNVGACL